MVPRYSYFTRIAFLKHIRYYEKKEFSIVSLVFLSLAITCSLGTVVSSAFVITSANFGVFVLIASLWNKPVLVGYKVKKKIAILAITANNFFFFYFNRLVRGHRYFTNTLLPTDSMRWVKPTLRCNMGSRDAYTM